MSATPGKLSVLSWNIDGLEEKCLQERTEGAISLILKIKPDVVLLQEVINDTLMSLLKNISQDYDILSNDGGYFNALLAKKDRNIHLIGEIEKYRFSNTAMERHYLLQKITFFNHSFVFITTHLESLKDHATERQEQLKECFDVMLSQNDNSNVIFGGDLNLREPELKAVKGIPNKISDAWESAGSRLETKFTWDLKLNNNKQFEWGKPRARYDRIYYRPGNKYPVHCVDFQLIGTERLSCKMFPSDHFGILATFTME